MKSFREFQRHAGAKTHSVVDPVTHKKITVPKGYSVPVSRSSSKGNGGDGSGNGNGGNGGNGN